MKIIDESKYHKVLLPQADLRFPQKINIHFVLRGRLHKLALAANDAIREVTESEIRFSDESFQVPHITIFMGFVTSLDNLEKLMRETHTFSKNLSSVPITLSSAYVESSQKKWAFIDVLEVEQMISLKKEFETVCKPFVESLSWDVVSQRPHITIGYINKNFERVQEYLKSIRTDGHYSLEAIEISFAGKRGTCVGGIRTYELKE